MCTGQQWKTAGAFMSMEITRRWPEWPAMGGTRPDGLDGGCRGWVFGFSHEVGVERRGVPFLLLGSGSTEILGLLGNFITGVGRRS